MMEVPEEMKTDRKWIALVSALTFALILTGCPKKKATPTVEAPPTTTVATPQPEEVGPTTAPAITDPVEEPPALSLQQQEEMARKAGLLGDVYYDFDQYDLRAEARERLARNAEWMKSEGRHLNFTIEGHCDERGTNEYNIALGQSRSTTAVDYLVSLGVAANRFKTVSFGEERPDCTESTEGCWQRNRRAHFVVTGEG